MTLTLSQAFLFESALALWSSKSSESELLPQLAAILSERPNVVNQTDSRGQTLLHYAARQRSPEFCRLLIEMDPKRMSTDIIQIADVIGYLPFHYSCTNKNFETARYLYSLYPESINIPAREGFYPLHCLLCSGSDEYGQGMTEMVQFLLKHDRGAVSAARDGKLPLHLACRFQSLDIVKLVFDSYPEGIHVKCYDGSTPLDKARYEIISFLDTQLNYEHQAREQLMSDMNGQLPIHRAVQDVNTSVGTIKLMLAANPNSALAVDHWGSTPLHLHVRLVISTK
eukprot:scaffold19553_cov64-Cyclotella_meneghiniana.AAC.3